MERKKEAIHIEVRRLFFKQLMKNQILARSLDIKKE